MTAEFILPESFASLATGKPILQSNSFVGNECVLKKCCKKYKKGKRCKKCPDS